MIDLGTVRDFCLALPGEITEEFPFDEEVLVFKVSGKIFLLTSVSALPFTVNLKCDPERAIELRERYPAVQPGYHMHKKYWNTVAPHEGLPERLFFELIRHSYDEVVKKLPKKKKAVLSSRKKRPSRT